MNIILHDHAPGVIMGQQLGKLINPKKKDLFVPGFAPLTEAELQIVNGDVTRLIGNNLASFVNLIGNAEGEKYSNLHIQGSPLRYLAYAELIGKDVSPQTLSKLKDIFDAVQGSTEVILYPIGSTSPAATKNGLISPRDMSVFEGHLSQAYTSHHNGKITVVSR